MSTIVEVDGSCPVAGRGDSVVVLLVDALGEVIIDVAGASVVTVVVRFTMYRRRLSLGIYGDLQTYTFLESL